VTRSLKILVVLGGMALAMAVSAYGATTSVLCLNDTPGATTCQGTDNMWIMLTLDSTVPGGSVTETQGAGISGPVSFTGFFAGGVAFLKVTSATVGVFTVTGDSGQLNPSGVTRSTESFSNSYSGAGTLNIFFCFKRHRGRAVWLGRHRNTR